MTVQVVPAPARVHSTPRGRVEILEQVPAGIAEDFRQIYRAAFAPLMTKSPARQWLTDEEFLHEMQDPKVLKFVAYGSPASRLSGTTGDSDEIVAMATLSSDLSTMPWISEPYFEQRFPDHYARKAIFYFGCLLVRPDRQGGPWAKYLLEHLICFVGDHNGIAAFDCCGFNVDTVALPDLIERACRPLIHVDMQELDRQTYYAGVFLGFKGAEAFR